MGSPRKKECGNCGFQDSWVLHHVRLRGIYRRLCTSCVLRLHPSSFCPACFTFFDASASAPPPPPSKRLSCSNCSSFTHSHCHSAAAAPAATPFLCPPCKDPNFAFFRFENPNHKFIDLNRARVFLCACKIAAASMAKAKAVAAAEAERRVREAALCRKRGREAVEHVTSPINKSPKPNNRNVVAEQQAETAGKNDEKMGFENGANAVKEGDRKLSNVPFKEAEAEAKAEVEDRKLSNVSVKEEAGSGSSSSLAQTTNDKLIIS